MSHPIFDLDKQYNRERIVKEQDALQDELATLRAQLAEARELIADAKVEIGFAIYGNTQPSVSAYDKLTTYLQKVKSA